MDSVGEVVTGVVDDPIGAETCYQVDLPGAGDSGDLRPGGLGQLHRVAADAAGGADDQHLLSWLQPAGRQRLQRGAAGDPEDRCLLEGDVRRLVGEFVLPGCGVLREGAPADAEHLVAHGELGDR
jgi:hypothetical protein